MHYLSLGSVCVCGIGAALAKLMIMGSRHVLSLDLNPNICTLFPPTDTFRGTIATHHHPT